jgi:O-antigen ligase
MLYLLKTLFVIDALMVIGLVLFRWALPISRRDIVSGKIITLALLTPAVALFGHNIFVFFAYLTLILAFSSKSRKELAATYVFILPLMPILSLETGVGGVYLFSISAITAMNFGALIGLFITSKKRVLTLPRYDVAALTLIAIFIYIYNRDSNFTSLLRGMTIYCLELGIPYLVVSRAIATREDIERLFLRLCLGGTLTAVTACIQARLHWVLFETYYQSLRIPLPTLSASLSLRAGLLRTGGSMVDYSAGGLFLAAVVTLMPFLRPRFRPAGFWVVMLTLVAGLIASQSRGAWVAAIVGLVFVSAYRGLWARVALLAGGAVAAEMFVLVFATSGRLASIIGQTEQANESVSYRKRLISQGMDQIWGHPLTGQSPGRLIDNLPELVQGQHIVDFVNSHLFVAMAAGIPLFVIWCCIWALPVIDGWKQRLTPDNVMEPCAAIVVTAMTAMIFTSIIDRNLTWPLIALGAAAPCFLVQKRTSRAQRAERAGVRTIGPIRNHTGTIAHV